jgi:hypothetical protein
MTSSTSSPTTTQPNRPSKSFRERLMPPSPSRHNQPMIHIGAIATHAKPNDRRHLGRNSPVRPPTFRAKRPTHHPHTSIPTIHLPRTTTKKPCRRTELRANRLVRSHPRSLYVTSNAETFHPIQTLRNSKSARSIARDAQSSSGQYPR